jgi:hypothetical protein
MLSPAAYTIDEFCETHRISRAFYYKLRGERRAPREMRAGARVLISVEAAADWRRDREAAATAEHVPEKMLSETADAEQPQHRRP